MIGDKMVLYDTKTERFFAGWREKTRETPLWSIYFDDARIVYDLAHAYRLKEKLGHVVGHGVRIMSVTEARRFDMLREYREATANA